MKITFLSAGAGTGKTWNLTKILYERLRGGSVRADAIMATTFTVKAAAELVERVRRRLLSEGQTDDVNRLSASYFGTVNSVCHSLLERYAFVAGMPPSLKVLDDNEGKVLFARVFEDAVDVRSVRTLMPIHQRFGHFDSNGKDWRDEIKRIVDLARSNNISSEKLADFASSSVDNLLSYFPASTDEDHDLSLKNALTRMMGTINDHGCQIPKTQKYATRAQNALRSLERRDLKWAEWVYFVKNEPSSKFREAVQEVQEIAAKYDRHPRLHGDLTVWIKTCFEMAAKVMDAYQEEKRRRGVIDFVDQELLCLGLLDEPHVRDQICEELDLLLVDEFQDTSPIQLALFVKLCSLAKETVWVGDPKQAIYGFRGSDPELMNMALQGIKNADKEGNSPWFNSSHTKVETKVQILDTSRRSIKPLVDLTNNLFVPAFADILNADEVAVKVNREESFAEPPVVFWNVKKSQRNGPGMWESVANGVADLLDSKRHVYDKDSKQYRPLRPSDIAVLCRNNDHCHEVANHLAGLGIATDVARPGLFQTSEVTLALSYLKFWADPADTMAQAHIVALQSDATPEEWLSHRIQHLNDEKPSKLWGLGDGLIVPGLQKLAQSRERLKLLSPAEALEEAVTLGDVWQTASQWAKSSHNANQRFANLEWLTELAMSYEQRCTDSCEPASISGLLDWFDELAEGKEDEIAAPMATHAVQVLTHHRAKGLEWPIVVSAGMEKKVSANYWGANIESDGKASLRDPLAGRRIRYWIWPFGNQGNGISVDERIEKSPVGQESVEHSAREAKRLLYVSFTRARDQLVVVVAGKPESQYWLNCLGADWFKPNESKLTTPSGVEIPCLTKTFDSARTVDNSESDYQRIWFSRTENPDRLPQHVAPSRAEPLVAAKIEETVNLGERIPINGSQDWSIAGQAIHDVMTIYFLGSEDLKADAFRILKGYGLGNTIDAGWVMESAERLVNFFKSRFGWCRFQPEVPVVGRNADGQVVSGSIDLLVYTDQGLVIVDHKSFAGVVDQLEDKALRFSGQLACYRDAVQGGGEDVHSQWIYFPMQGQVVGLKF
jgi:ATP-dependent exoDNAse (exonuclease V) beta subunit